MASLVKQIDSKIGENDKLKSFVVLLSQDEKAPEALEKLAKDNKIKHVPLTVHGDPGEVPSYELSKEADTTVLMWVGGTVKVNHAYKGELTDKDIKAIVADVSKILE